MVRTENSERLEEADFGVTQEPVYGYSMSQVLDAEASVQVTFGMEGRERKMRTLH